MKDAILCLMALMLALLLTLLGSAFGILTAVAPAIETTALRVHGVPKERQREHLLRRKQHLFPGKKIIIISEQ